ncbi:MAG: FAD-dependent oxidoreductase [Bacilli bacterium]
MKYDFDCVIVGSGISGMTSAIYLKRANAKILILDKDAPGGLLNKVTTVENYPGFKKITGPELAFNIYDQVKNLDIEIRYGNVLNIKDHIITTDIEKISASKIIIATGRNSRKLDLNNNLSNVSYCALCDGNLYKNKIVAVIGGANSALEEALYLSDLCQEVLIMNRSSSLGGDAILINAVNNTPNIKVLLDCVVKTLNSNNNVLTSIETNNSNYQVDAMFISIGYEPSSNFLEELKKDNGYIIVDNNMQTNIDYIYACGDIIKKNIYQLTTAVGEATTAAINVKKTL